MLRPRFALPAAFATLTLATALLAGGARGQEPRVVEIAAKRFAFTPAEVVLKAGEPVVLRLHSEDVTHGFFHRGLGIDATIEPGKTVEVPLRPTTPGRYTVICDHFCGSGHGNMKLTLVVE